MADLTPAQEVRAIELIRNNWGDEQQRLHGEKFDEGELCHSCGEHVATFVMSDSPVRSSDCALSIAQWYCDCATGHEEVRNAEGIYEDVESFIEQAEREVEDATV